MAQTEPTTPAAGAAAPDAGRKRKRMLFGGAAVLLPALGWALALVAVPARTVPQDFVGPFVAPLTPEKVQVNLSDSKSFLILDLNLVYEAYDERYYGLRCADPMYAAEIKDVLVAIASAKTREQVSDKVNKPIFMEEIRKAVDPLLFPVHVGETRRPTDREKRSGLAPGLSSSEGTFRGPFRHHLLKVDAPNRTLQVDDGPPTTWSGGEVDLPVPTADDRVLFVDVSHVEPEFVGELPLGVHGRVRKVLWNEVLIQ